MIEKLYDYVKLFGWSWGIPSNSMYDIICYLIIIQYNLLPNLMHDDQYVDHVSISKTCISFVQWLICL